MKWLVFALAFMLLLGCPAEEAPPSGEEEAAPGQEGHFEITGGEGAVVSEGELPEIPEIPATEYAQNPNADLEVYFINVGQRNVQGDAILIKKGDVDILIDAGPDISEKDLVDFLYEKGVDDIEVLVSTHDDPEHYGGMKYVSEKFPIGEIWRSTEGSSSYSTYLNSLGAEGVKEVWQGDTEDINGMVFTVLNPVRGEDRFYDPTNDGVVLKLEDRGLCVLFTGDILYPAQQLVAPQAVDCQIVQFPNHGMSSGLAHIDYFFDQIEPDVVVISGGPEDWTKSRITLTEKAELRDIVVLENYDGEAVVITYDGDRYTAGIEE